MADTTVRADQLDATAVIKGTTTVRADQLDIVVVGYRTDGGTAPPGSITDLLNRLEMLMPPWFGELSGRTKPVLDGFLTGPATILSWFKSLIDFVKLQTRLSTMSGGFLDLFAQDYFGSDLLRKTGELDDAYRIRIKAEFFKASNTKAALIAAIADITSATPTFIEWWRTDQTGVWDGAAGNGRTYWDVNTTDTPFRWTSPGVFLEISVTDSETRRLIFVALCRYKAEGIVIWVKFPS